MLFIKICQYSTPIFSILLFFCIEWQGLGIFALIINLGTSILYFLRKDIFSLRTTSYWNKSLVIWSINFLFLILVFILCINLFNFNLNTLILPFLLFLYLAGFIYFILNMSLFADISRYNHINYPLVLIFTKLIIIYSITGLLLYAD